MRAAGNSDDLLLIWSDWLEEYGFLDEAQEIRQDVATIPVTGWSWEYRIGVGGIGGGGGGIGGGGGGIGVGIGVGGGGIGVGIGVGE